MRISAGMGPLLKEYGPKLGLDMSSLEALEEENSEKVKELDEAIEDAKQNYGDAEVFDAMKAKAQYFGTIGDVARAVESYDSIPVKLSSTGQQVDLEMAKTLLYFMVGDFKSVSETLKKAQDLNKKGGDWDRRNRMQVYEAAYRMAAREFEDAASLLLDSVATFTCYEMFDYTRFIMFTTLCALLTQDRPVLKKQVVDSPDIRSVIGDLGPLRKLLTSFHDCKFDQFMAALVEISHSVQRDRFLRPHQSYIVRQLRVRAYQQFLGAYKTVTMSGMSKAFGVSEEFMDKELSHYIAAGKLSAKIDKVSGVVEVTRPDVKSARYSDLLKQGDALLNKVQRLTRIVNV